MPCKCLTGCINKKCSCRAKGIDCTEECAYCKKEDSKYECFNLPGKEPPVKPKSKSNSKRSSRKNSKISNNSDSDSENERAIVKPSKELTKKKSESKENETTQTVIINNYYYHNEYKQQNNAYTQVINHNYEIGENENPNSANGVHNLIKNLSLSDEEDDGEEEEKSHSRSGNEKTENENSSTNSNSIPKLTEALADEFLKFYWECLSSKSKTKYIEKYICSLAELKIQDVPFIGAKAITKRLEEAAPIKINDIHHKIYPVSTPTKKFSVTNINNKLLGLPSSSSKSSLISPSSSSKNLALYQGSLSSSTSSSTTSLHTRTKEATADTTAKSLVLTDPNLPAIGRIETNGVMMDANGYTAQFIQNYHLVYNRMTKDVQIKSSELKWL